MIFIKDKQTFAIWTGQIGGGGREIRRKFFLPCHQLDPLGQGGLLVLLGPN